MLRPIRLGLWLAMILPAPAAAGRKVDLELILMADASGSTECSSDRKQDWCMKTYGR